MTAFILVGLGGALGSIARYGVALLAGRVWPMSFPLSTLLVNVLGSFVMGLFFGWMARLLPGWQHEARLFIAIGLLGGFTTFSSFSLDTILLLERGALAQAAIYVALSVVVCLAGLYLGVLITRGGTA
jgi:CrcB protein